MEMLKWGKTKEVLEYFDRVIYLYKEWGVSVKVAQIVSHVKEMLGATISMSSQPQAFIFFLQKQRGKKNGHP